MYIFSMANRYYDICIHSTNKSLNAMVSWLYKKVYHITRLFSYFRGTAKTQNTQN